MTDKELRFQCLMLATQMADYRDVSSILTTAKHLENYIMRADVGDTVLDRFVRSQEAH